MLSIKEFENEHRGTYECIVSTTSQPIVSVSAKLELEFHCGNFTLINTINIESGIFL